ncbi:hypothetical protein GCM10027445_17780 [Amycolatopsis endophytica]|uniref:Uncharacterized protein n=1 Tax=Amycolatopsis endophytica TaxID=860233 RepID=A0A853B5F0_9PSEU|nr:hypothetical protein [Amycolatopsis endophytica]
MWTISPVPVTDPAAARVLRDYFGEVASRYYGRPATVDELDAAMTDDPSADLVPPTGLSCSRGRTMW